MTNQLQGEILFAGWAGASGSGADEATWANTPWMPVRGDIATFGVEVFSINGLTLGWEVQTRTAEDGLATTIATGPSITAPGVDYVTNTLASKLKQLFRYRFKTGSTASATNYVIVRALQPSWQADR